MNRLVDEGKITVEHNDKDESGRVWVITKMKVTADRVLTMGMPNTITASSTNSVNVDGLRDTDNRSKAVQKTPWRVSLDAMKRRITSVEYINPEMLPTMNICVVMLDNGYVLVGESAPADPANYNEQLGREYAFENALKKMWPLEAYVMRDLLSGKIEMPGDAAIVRWGASGL